MYIYIYIRSLPTEQEGSLTSVSLRGVGARGRPGKSVRARLPALKSSVPARREKLVYRSANTTTSRQRGKSDNT